MRRTGRELRAILRAETPTHRRYRDHLTVIVVATLAAATGAFIQKRGIELDAKSGNRPG